MQTLMHVSQDLTVGVMWPVAISSCRFDVPTMVDCSLQSYHINTFSFKKLLSEYFIIAIGSEIKILGKTDDLSKFESQSPCVVGRKETTVHSCLQSSTWALRYLCRPSPLFSTQTHKINNYKNFRGWKITWEGKQKMNLAETKESFARESRDQGWKEDPLLKEQKEEPSLRS